MSGLSPNASYRGHIDSVGDGSVSGWVYDSALPQKRLIVEIYAAGVLLGTARADGFRSDLAQANIGDGMYGFTYSLSTAAAAAGKITAQVETTHYWLLDSSTQRDRFEATNSVLSNTISRDWARSISEPDEFRLEQRRLSHTWTFLGLTRDAEKDGDWFRASLATRSVFVQRFGEDLRGFENVCRHRFHPLRTEDRGNGPIQCGFHHWLYNRDGQAVGIPVCKEVYGKTPHEMGVRLNPVEIATCGSLVFGRFPAAHATQSLEDYLGEAFPILAAITRITREPFRTTPTLNANWKLGLYISLDDYHSPAVHPTTYGKRVGYLHRQNVQYQPIGMHSAFLQTPDTQEYANLLRGCRDGTYRSNCYFIIQVLPNLAVSHVRLYKQFWFCNIEQYSPVAHDRTVFRSWSYPAPFTANHAWHVPMTRVVSDPIRRWIFRHYYRRVTGEDRAVCERVQRVAHQVDQAPMLSALETRIAWFEGSLKRLLEPGMAEISAETEGQGSQPS